MDETAPGNHCEEIASIYILRHKSNGTFRELQEDVTWNEENHDNSDGLNGSRDIHKSVSKQTVPLQTFTGEARTIGVIR